MREILDKYTFFQVVFALCVSIGLAAPSSDPDLNERIYPFEQRIHDLCRGHGTMYMNKNEVENIIGRVSRYYDEILNLVDKSDSDSYLSQLVNIVRMSKLSEVKKKAFYDKVYSRYLERKKNGEEWNDVIIILIQSTDILSDNEIKKYIKSESKYVRDAAKNKLTRRERVDRMEHRPQMGYADQGGDNTNNSPILNSNNLKWVYSIVVFLLIGILLTLKMAKLKN